MGVYSAIGSLESSSFTGHNDNDVSIKKKPPVNCTRTDDGDGLLCKASKAAPVSFEPIKSSCPMVASSEIDCAQPNILTSKSEEVKATADVLHESNLLNSEKVN